MKLVKSQLKNIEFINSEIIPQIQDLENRGILTESDKPAIQVLLIAYDELISHLIETKKFFKTDYKTFKTKILKIKKEQLALKEKVFNESHHIKDKDWLTDKIGALKSEIARLESYQDYETIKLNAEFRIEPTTAFSFSAAAGRVLNLLKESGLSIGARTRLVNTFGIGGNGENLTQAIERMLKNVEKN